MFDWKVPHGRPNSTAIIGAGLAENPAGILQRHFGERDEVLGVTLRLASIDNPGARLGDYGAEEGRAPNVSVLVAEADRQPLGPGQCLISTVSL